MKGAALALGFGVLVAFVVVEVALRLYNPIELRLRGTRIVLPTHTRTVLHLHNARQLGSPIHMSRPRSASAAPSHPTRSTPQLRSWPSAAAPRNACCCQTTRRGPRSSRAGWRRAYRAYGSTTQARRALDGHSTYGHLELLRQLLAPLRPRYALFRRANGW